MEIKREDYFREIDSPYTRFCKYNYLSGNKYKTIDFKEFYIKCYKNKHFRKLFFTEEEWINKDILYNNINLRDVKKYKIYKTYNKDYIDDFIIVKHKFYISILLIGTIFWMSSCFLIPFIIGFVHGINNLPPGWTREHLAITGGCFEGFGYILIFMTFGGFILVPLTIIGSVTLWPSFLKMIMFTHEEPVFSPYHNNDKHAFYPDIMAMLKCKGIEKTNAAAVIGSQFL